MEDKQIDVGTSMDDRIERIKEAEARGRSLEAIEEAVDMTAADGSFAKLGSDEEHAQGINQLESFILGDLS